MGHFTLLFHIKPPKSWAYITRKHISVGTSCDSQAWGATDWTRETSSSLPRPRATSAAPHLTSRAETAGIRSTNLSYTKGDLGLHRPITLGAALWPCLAHCHPRLQSTVYPAPCLPCPLPTCPPCCPYKWALLSSGPILLHLSSQQTTLFPASQRKSTLWVTSVASSAHRGIYVSICTLFSSSI